MNNIRVLQIGADNLGYGGRSVVVYNLTQHIESDDIENDFLYFGSKVPEECKKNIEKKGGKIVDIGKIQSDRFFILREYDRFKRMKMSIKQGQYDIVHINADNAYEAMKSIIIARCAGVKIIFVHAHTTGNEKEGSFLLNRIIHICQILLPHCISCSLACSKEAASYLFGKVPDDICIIKNGIDIEKFKFDNNIRVGLRNKMNLDNKLVIGCVGRFAYPKNHKFLLQVFREFKKTHQESVLMLIGEGKLRKEIEEYAKSLDILENVMFMGNRQDVNELLQAMDLFCLTSFYEGFGIVNIEAQAAGLPCVVSDCVPHMAKLNDNFTFLSINEPIPVWIETMNHMFRKGREKSIDKIMQNGFDISKSASMVERLYRENTCI